MKHKRFSSFLALVLFITIILSGCNKPTVPTANVENRQEPTRPSITFPTPVSGEKTYSGKEDTNPEGKVMFQDPMNNANVSVQVVSYETNEPLSDISVSFISNGAQLLVISVDPQNQYLPSIQEIDYQQIGYKYDEGSAKLAAPPKQMGIVEVLLLMKLISTFQTAKDFWAWINSNNMPNLERWSFLSQDYCIDSDKMSRSWKVAVGITSFVLPGPKDLMESISSITVFQDWVYIAAMAEIGQDTHVDRVKEGVPEGIIRWRVYSINGIQIGVPAVPIGWCLEPLNRTSKDSILKWFEYGLDKSDMFVFEHLSGDRIQYSSFGIEPPEQYFSKSELMSGLKKGVGSQPKCDSYDSSEFEGSSYLGIYTKPWSPNSFFDFGDDEYIFWFSNKNSPDGGMYIYGLVFNNTKYMDWVKGANACPLFPDSQSYLELSGINQKPDNPINSKNTKKRIIEDFSSYRLGVPPEGWLLRGEKSITPIIEESGGNGSAYRVVEFPEVESEYWDKWLLYPDPVLSDSYSITVKMKFMNGIADGAGITIAWDDASWDRIDIRPNLYWDEIEFRITYSGNISSIPVIDKRKVAIDAYKDYWLRAVVIDDGPGNGQVTVYWSTDGVNFDPAAVASGLATVDGFVGLGTTGPHLPEMIFDDFEIIEN